MIDEIFEMIMKEARAKPQKDLVLNINLVLLEIFTKLLTVQENIREAERRENTDANKRADT